MKKYLKLNLTLLIVILTVSSCDQNMIGASYAIKNLVATPFKAVGNSLSERAYKEVQKKSEAKSNSNIPTECWVTRKSVLPGMESIEQLANAVRKNVCSCVPWGSCTTEECPCSRMCPEGFDIFKRPGQKSTADHSVRENSLSFINGGGGGDIEATQGFCWGHASVTSKFNRLAFFDKNEKPKFNLRSRDRSEQSKAFEYYKELIDDVIDNKPTSIPGISNLNELSSIPGIESYMADKVAHAWAERAMSSAGLGIALKTGAMNKKDSVAFFDTIKDKIDQNQQPQIVFTKKGKAMLTHAVLVSHYIKERDGSTTLCIRDNNRSRGSIDRVKNNCVDKMTIRRDGSINYSQWGNLGGTEIAYNENPDALTQVENLKEHCDKEKGCSK